MASYNIYTKNGDKGETSLIGGVRVKKDNKRVVLYGEIDELSSVIGIALSHAQDDKYLYEIEFDFVQSIQKKLMQVGSLIACEKTKWSDYKLTPLVDDIVSEVEVRIDHLTDELPELTAFILPGGHLFAAHLHLARTVCRRVERGCVALVDEDIIPDHLIKYLNRLSDYFFMLARHVNFKEKRTSLKEE